MKTLILKENVLTDDLLLLADEGKVFKGGYKAIIKQYFFNTAWTDKETVFKFRSRKQINKFITKHYPAFEQY